MSEFSKEWQVAPTKEVKEVKEVKETKEVKAEAPKAKKAKKDLSKTPANESQVASRVAAVSRNLKTNEGQQKVAGEPNPIAASRGALIAAKFVARAAQRNS